MCKSNHNKPKKNILTAFLSEVTDFIILIYFNSGAVMLNTEGDRPRIRGADTLEHREGAGS